MNARLNNLINATRNAKVRLINSLPWNRLANLIMADNARLAAGLNQSMTENARLRELLASLDSHVDEMDDRIEELEGMDHASVDDIIESDDFNHAIESAIESAIDNCELVEESDLEEQVLEILQQADLSIDIRINR